MYWLDGDDAALESSGDEDFDGCLWSDTEFDVEEPEPVCQCQGRI